jgi:hypothetical protein
MLLRQRHDSAERMTYWINIGGLNMTPEGHDPAKPYTAGWFKMKDGSLWRSSYLPPGMSTDVAERLLGEDYT